jgi:hypothetical protein
MSDKGMVTITDGEGWRKTFPLQSQLIHIGSDAANDIVLDPGRGSGVAPRHLQLLALPTGAYRAVNLSGSDIILGESGDQTFAPRSILDVGHGASLRLGDFLLAFGLEGEAVPELRQEPVRSPPVRPAPPRPVPLADGDGRTSSVEETGEAIGLRLVLPEPVLRPDRPLEGQVSVRNLGREPGVQFKLEVQGLEPDCYDIGPGPILFPNVQKSVFLRLQHPRRPSPPAGPLEIRIRASAPDFYPGGSVSVSQEIEVLPYLAHSMTLVPED